MAWMMPYDRDLDERRIRITTFSEEIYFLVSEEQRARVLELQLAQLAAIDQLMVHTYAWGYRAHARRLRQWLLILAQPWRLWTRSRPGVTP